MTDYDVVIVGSGLSGLCLALDLAKTGGVKVVILDKCKNQEERFQNIKGGGLVLTPISVLWADKVGVIDELKGLEGSSITLNLEDIQNPQLIRNGKLKDNDPSVKSDNNADDPSSASGSQRATLHKKKEFGDRCFYLHMDQKRVEEIIMNRLIKKFSHVKILWGHELSAIDQSDGKVTATFKTLEESSISYSAPFLVGCDGRDSKVRNLHFVPNVEDFDWAEHKGVMLHMMCETKLDWKLERKYYRLEQKSLNGLGPMTGGGAIIPVPGEDKELYRVSVNAPFTMWGSTIDCLESPNFSLLKKQLSPKLPKDAILNTPEWAIYYRMNHFISTRFHDGKIFLAGDAAHSHPPVGLQPMNASIQDAINLSWKLRQALQLNLKDSDAALFDSYDRERGQAAKQVHQSIADYFSDLMQGNLQPSKYAFKNCQLFSQYTDSPIIIQSKKEDEFGVKSGEIMVNISSLLMTNTMKVVSLLDVMMTSHKHKVFLLCPIWAKKFESPRNSEYNVDGLGSSGESYSGGEIATASWGNLQQDIELILGPEVLPLVEFYIVHKTPKFSHGDGVDTSMTSQLVSDTFHIVDESSKIATECFKDTACFGGLIVRPDMYIGCIGTFPEFIDQIRGYVSGML